MNRSRSDRAITHLRPSLAALPVFKRVLSCSTLGLMLLALPGLAAAVVGTSAGNFNVGAGGEASFAVPITVPPGTAGMRPELSLMYNSQGGNGAAGMGVELAGLSTITRCPRTKASDGARGGINLDANDRFCLDGQRLMVTAGTYGANAAEYRTELETFSKIISYGTAGTGPAWFKVWTKAGQIVEYGNTTDSRILAAGKTTALIWAQNKVIDAKGNYLTVSYVNNNAGGEYYPTRVDYTGNAAAGIAPYASVRFTYATRSDVESAYVAGSVVRSTVRLTNVKSYYGATLVKSYNMGYQTGTASKRSRLTSIQECDGAATPVCLPATTLVWQEGSSSFGSSFSGPAWANASGWSDPKYYSTINHPDLNGDGKADICARAAAGITCALSVGTGYGTGIAGPAWSDASGWGAHKHYSTISYPDINGDGKADICGRSPSGITCALSTGTSFGAAFNGPAWSDASGWGDPQHYSTIRFPDINGDGRADICARAGVGITCAFSAGTSFGAGVAGPAWSNASGWGAEQYNSTINYPDINGDGMADVCGRASTGVICVLSTGSGFSGSITGPAWSNAAGWSAAEHYSTIQFSDINGDGKADICARAPSGIICAPSTGAGFAAAFSGPAWTSASGWSDPQYYSSNRYPDLNGDGKADVCGRASSGITCAISTGTGFGAAVSGPAWSTASGWGAEQHNSTIHYSDINGDGKGDICGRASTGIICYFAAGVAADLLTSVTNGLGASTTISYQPLTNASIYVKDTNAVYPVMDVQTPMYVVASATATNGVGGSSLTSYDYGGLKVDLNGRGLGFRWMDVLDTSTGIATRSDYSQTYPYIGTATRVKTTRVSPSTILSDTTHTLGNQALGGSRYFPFVAQTVDKRHELSGTLITTKTTSQTLDAYGNPLTVTVSNVGGGSTFTSLTTNTYSNNASTWILGLLAQSSVKNTLPGGSNATRTSSFVYNASGQLTSETVEPGIPALSQVSSYSYDAFGNRTGMTISGSGIATRTSTVAWNSNGRFPVSTTNALGHVETSVYENNFGNRSSVTDANAQVTSWTYDSFGRKIGETRPGGGTSSVSYAACGTCPANGSYFITTTSSGAPTSKTYYDKLQRVLRNETQGFAGTAIYQDTQYNSLGQAFKVSHPYYSGAAVYWVTTVFDAIGRSISVTDPDGGVNSISYNGLSSTVTNQLGQTKTTTVDALGRNQIVTEAAGSVSYSYDPFGNLLTSTDPLGNKILMSYDLRGFKTAQTDPDLGAWSFVSNVLGQVVSQTDAKGQVTSFTYDKLGRMTQRVQPGQTDTWVFDTAIKGKGKLASSSTNNGFSRTHSYDSYGRPSSVSTTVDANFSNMTVSTAYDSAGRVTTVTYPTGFAVKNVYNTWGHLAEVRNNASNALYWRADTRNADGALTRSTLGNGLNSNYTYQANNGNLTRIYTGVSNGSGVQDQSFGYDLGDNLTSRSDARTGVVEGFSYDSMNRLTQSRVTAPVVVTKNYSYNAIGNLLSKSDTGTYTYHATKKHAVASIAGAINTSFSYDANGNMLTGNGRTLTWNSWNMIASNSFLGGSFSYDADHVRTRMTNFIGGKTYYLEPRWDAGVNFEKEYFVGGQIEYRHSIYAGAGAPVAMYISGTTAGSQPISLTRYFHSDQLGSLTVISNESGEVLERRSYDPHGRLRNTNGSDTSIAIQLGTTPHAFTGHESLDDRWVTNSSGASLINMNGRVYDPQIGRFMSADPFIQSPDSTQSFNRYSYVNNNPLSLTDPSGYFSLRKAFKKIGHAISKAFKNPIVRVAVVVAAAAITGGAAAGAYGSYAAAAGGSAFTIGGSVAVTSGIISGAAGGFVAGGLMGGNLKSAALGAITGAIGGGVAGHFGNSYGPARVATESLVGGINARIQGDSFVSGLTRAAAFSLLTYGNWAMRQDQIKNSGLNPANANGNSAGMFGDGFKLAGARREYLNGVPLACDAPLGGCQGAIGLADGDVAARFGPIHYKPGSIFDTINESFAGPHDYFRNMTGSYTAMGNSVSITSAAGKFYDGYVKNFGMLIPAAPFSLAGLVQTQAPAVIYLSGQR